MGLNATEQLKIINRAEGSPQPSDVGLTELVAQNALIKASEMVESFKDIPEGESLGSSYLAKVNSVIRLIFRNDGDTNRRLMRIFVMLIGRTSNNWNDILNATDSQWTSFCYDQADEGIEYLAGVTHQEKTAYKAIP